jgi:glucosylceramidase
MKYIFTLLCFLSSGYLLNAQIWTTNADQSTLLQKSNYQLASVSKDIPVIAINEKKTFQTVDGFGFTLTGGSAMLINRRAMLQLKRQTPVELAVELILLGGFLGVNHL